MADLATDSSPHLFALTLARSLDLELSDTTEICLGGSVSTSELTSEVRLCTLSASEDLTLLQRNSSQKSNPSSTAS
jgi:hypothetical protein